MHHFPKWLPPDIAKHCKNKLDPENKLNAEQEYCIHRLATQDNMRFAWEALMKVTDNTELMIDLIEYVRLHPAVMYAGINTQQLTSAKQRKGLKEISVLSERLLNALAQLNQVDHNPNEGMAFLKSELRRLQNQAASLQFGATVVRSHHHITMLEAVDAEYGIAQTLQTLHEASMLAMEAPSEGPRKKGAKTASRTALIKDLKRYIQFHFGQKLNQVVATFVNTALNLKDDAVSEDMVRKA
jgi:hypothetical protein